MRSRMLALGVIAAATCGCGSDGDGAAPARDQSFAEALRILCGGEAVPDWSSLSPARRDDEAARWLDRRITSRAGRALLAGLADADDRAGRVRAAAERAGLASCRPLALFPRTSLIAGAHVPELAGAEAATDELDQDQPIVVIAPTGVRVDGMTVAAVTDGEVAADGAPRVATALRASAAAQHLDLATVTVVADRTLALRAVLPVLDAVRLAGGRRVELVAAAGATGAHRVIPLALLAARTGADPGVMAVVGDRTVAVFATAGEPGRAEGPLHSPGALRETVQAWLHELVTARWHGATRAPGELEIAVLLAGGSASMQDVVGALAALRATPDGVVLFPDLVLVTAPAPP